MLGSPLVDPARRAITGIVERRLDRLSGRQRFLETAQAEAREILLGRYADHGLEGPGKMEAAQAGPGGQVGQREGLVAMAFDVAADGLDSLSI